MVAFSSDAHTRSADADNIDLLQWADVAGVPFPFPMPAAVTPALWDELQTPSRNVPVHERVAHVVRKAAQAVERALRTRTGAAALEAFSVDFGVHLDSGGEAGWRSLRLACRPAATGELRLLVGFPCELPQASSPTSSPPRHDA